jgi:hypothetical protein
MKANGKKLTLEKQDVARLMVKASIKTGCGSLVCSRPPPPPKTRNTNLQDGCVVDPFA